MAESQLALSWDNFQQTMQSGIFRLLEAEDLVDVTFCVEGKKLKAHKMILSVCSPFFKELFESNPCQHPIIFLNDVKYRVMKDLLTYMYKGEVLLTQELLPAFVRLGENLQIRGLTNDEPQPSSTTPIDHRIFTESLPIQTLSVPKATSTPTIRRTMTTMVRSNPSGGGIKKPAPSNSTSAVQHTTSPPDSSAYPGPMKRPRLVGHKTRFILDNGRIPKEEKIEKEEVSSGAEGENDENTIYLEDTQQHNYSFGTTNKPLNTRPGRRKGTTASTPVTTVDPMEMELAIIHQGQLDDQTITGGDSECGESEHVIIGGDGVEDIVLEQVDDGDGIGEELEEDMIDDGEELTETKLILETVDGEVEDSIDEGAMVATDEETKHDGGEITLVRTVRKQEMPRYIVDGFVFHVNIMKGNPPMTYLRCLEYKRLGCHARAVMPTNGSIQDIQLTQMHNHPPDFAAEEKIVFMRELKDFLLRHMNLSTKEVYDLLQPIYPTAAQETPYDTIKNKMGRWKRSFILDNEIDMRLSGMEPPSETTSSRKRGSKVEMIIPD